MQQTLAANQVTLAETGYFYPSFEKNHRFLTSCFIDNPLVFDYNKYLGLTSADEIDKNNSSKKLLLEEQFSSSNCSSLILSSEHLVLLSEGGAHLLRDYLLTIVEEIKIIVYFRHPADSVGSFIQEAAKNGEDTIANLEKKVPYTRIKPLLERWSSVFGTEAIIARDCQSKILVNDNLVDDFLSAIGFPIADSSFARITSNQSLSQFAVEIADRLALRYPKFSKERAVQRHITRILSRIPGPKYRPASAVVRSAIDSSQQELAYLEDVWSLQLVTHCSYLHDEEPKRTLDDQTLDILAEIVNDAAHRETTRSSKKSRLIQ